MNNPDNADDGIRLKLKDLPIMKMIEMPCFVESSDDALWKMLGAEFEDKVIAQLNDNISTLEVKFPTNNPFQPSITAEKMKVNHLLITMKRKDNATATEVEQLNSSAVTIKHVGKIISSYRFNQPSDYQFLPSALGIDPSLTISKTIQGDPLIEIVPQSFAKTTFKNTKYPSLFENTKRKKKMANLINLPSNDTIPNDLQSHTITQEIETNDMTRNFSNSLKFGDPIPMGHTQGKLPKKWENLDKSFRGIQIIDKLTKIFADIPINSRRQLELMLQLDRHVFLFQECITYVAFYYIDGPFRGLWVRYGYDPARHSESRFLQIINFRASSIILRDICRRIPERLGYDTINNKIINLDKMIMESNSTEQERKYRLKGTVLVTKFPILLFDQIIRNQFSLQMYQMTDEKAFHILKDSVIFNECSPMGWFPTSTLNTLRDLILKIIVERVNQFIDYHLQRDKDLTTLSFFQPRDYLHKLPNYTKSENLEKYKYLESYSKSLNSFQWIESYWICNELNPPSVTPFTPSLPSYLNAERKSTDKVIKPLKRERSGKENVDDDEDMHMNKVFKKSDVVLPSVHASGAQNVIDSYGIEKNIVSAFDVFEEDDHEDEYGEDDEVNINSDDERGDFGHEGKDDDSFENEDDEF